jgi:hypothetical protein
MDEPGLPMKNKPIRKGGIGLKRKRFLRTRFLIPILGMLILTSGAFATDDVDKNVFFLERRKCPGSRLVGWDRRGYLYGGTVHSDSEMLLTVIPFCILPLALIPPMPEEIHIIKKFLLCMATMNLAEN